MDSINKAYSGMPLSDVMKIIMIINSKSTREITKYEFGNPVFQAIQANELTLRFVWKDFGYLLGH